MRRWTIALGAVVVAAAGAAVWWARSQPPEPPAVAAVPAAPPVIDAPAAASGAAPAIEAVASAPAPAASSARPPERRAQDLYADFQLAQGSTQLSTIERGIAAYEECFLYADAGGIEGFVTGSIPEGLDKAEWDRRANALRARARRCAGFASQDGRARLRELQDAAVAAGSLAERSRRVAQDPATAQEQTTVACAAVRGLPASRPAIRFIGPALNEAAARRPDHLLNAAAPPVRGIAVSLAMCDLDPAACSRMLGVADTACAEEGLCDLTSDRDYLQRSVAPEAFGAADALARQIVGLVARKDCAALFQ